MFSVKTEKIDFAHKVDPASHPMEEYGKHMHLFYELLFFVKGDVVYTVETEARRLQKGDIVLIASGKYHFADVNPDITYERYVLKFDESIVPAYLKDKINAENPFFINTGSYERHFRNLDAYVCQYDSDAAETMLTAELLQLLVEVTSNPVHQSGDCNEFISELITYIDFHLKEKMTLDSLADHFHFSKSYISSEFRKQMKSPIIHYIKTKKIMAAHQAILQGTGKTKAAEMFGFDEYSTFYREYKKVMKNN